MIITVQSIKPPAAGRKRFLISTTDGQKFGARQNVASMLREGGTYDAVTEEWEYEGKSYCDIKKAAPAAAASAPVARAPDAREQIFVQGLLQALIRAGEVKKDKQSLWEATLTIRALWRHTFGADHLRQQMQAAE